MRFTSLDDLARLVGNSADERIDDDAQEAISMSRYSNDELGRPADSIVVERARKLCFSRQQDPNKFEHINAATIEVLKADKTLAAAYKRLDEAVE